MSNIKRQLPKIAYIQDTNLRAWINAATEIINGLLSGNKPQVMTVSVAKVATSKSNNDGFERSENKVDTLDNPNREQYPSTLLIYNVMKELNRQLQNQDDYDEWDIASETLEDIGAERGNILTLISNGEYLGQQLYIDDVVKVYIEDIGESSRLNVIKILDSKALNADTVTSDDITEGINHLYFTDSRVKTTLLSDLPSNTGTYILKAVDGVLVWVEE